MTSANLTSARAIVSAIVLSLVISACGGRDGGGATGTQSPPPSAGRNQVNPMPREKIQDGGKFTWPIDAMPPNFNYNQLDGTQHDNAYVAWALMPTTFTNDAAGNTA